jgi:hypothetical protein
LVIMDFSDLCPCSSLRLSLALFPLLQLAWFAIFELRALVFDQSVPACAPRLPGGGQAADRSDLVRTSLPMRTRRQVTHQLQGCGVIFLKEFISRPWRMGPARLVQLGCSGMHAYLTPYAF